MADCNLSGKDPVAVAKEIKKVLQKRLKPFNKALGSPIREELKSTAGKTIWLRVRAGLLADIVQRGGEFFASIVSYEKRLISAGVANIATGNVKEGLALLSHFKVLGAYKDAAARLLNKKSRAKFKRRAKENGLPVTLAEFFTSAKVVKKERYDIDVGADNPWKAELYFGENTLALLSSKFESTFGKVSKSVDENSFAKLWDNTSELFQFAERGIPMLTDALVESGAITTILSRQTSVFRGSIQKTAKELGLNPVQVEELTDIFSDYFYKTLTHQHDDIAKEIADRLVKVTEDSMNDYTELIFELMKKNADEGLDEMASLTFKRDLINENRSELVRMLGKLDKLLRQKSTTSTLLVAGFLRTGVNLTSEGFQLLLPFGSVKKMLTKKTAFERVEAATEIGLAVTGWYFLNNLRESGQTGFDEKIKQSYIQVGDKKYDLKRTHPTLQDALNVFNITMDVMEKAQTTKEISPSIIIAMQQEGVDPKIIADFQKQIQEKTTLMNNLVEAGSNVTQSLINKHFRNFLQLGYKLGSTKSNITIFLTQLMHMPWDSVTDFVGFIMDTEEENVMDRETFKVYMDTYDAISQRYGTVRALGKYFGLIEPFQRQIDVKGHTVIGKRTFARGTYQVTGNEPFEQYARGVGLILYPNYDKEYTVRKDPDLVMKVPRNYPEILGKILTSKTFNGKTYTEAMNSYVQELKDLGVHKRDPYKAKMMIKAFHDTLYGVANKKAKKEIGNTLDEEAKAEAAIIKRALGK